MKSDNLLHDWHDAESFTDLCILMNRSLTENFESLISGVDEGTGCVLDEDSIKYRDDFIKLNNLGLLTIDSQPGLSEFNEINNDTEVCTGKQYNKADLNGWFDIYEQRNYVEGFIEKHRLQKILPKLYNYIVCIQSSYCTGDKVKILHDYKYKLEQNKTYFFIPKNFDNTWPDSSSVLPTFESSIRDGYYLVNLSRYTYSPTRAPIFDEQYMDHVTNLHFEKDSCNFDSEYYFKYLKKHLEDWMADNTYLITIISPAYGTTCLNKFLIELLSS